MRKRTPETLLVTPFACAPHGATGGPWLLDKMKGNPMKSIFGAFTAFGVAFAVSTNAHAACIMEEGSTPEDGSCAVIFHDYHYYSDYGFTGDEVTLNYSRAGHRWTDDDFYYSRFDYFANANLPGFYVTPRAHVMAVPSKHHSTPPISISAKTGKATYWGSANGVYALASHNFISTGAIKGDVQLAADFSQDRISGTFDGFSILADSATTGEWLNIGLAISMSADIGKVEDYISEHDEGFQGSGQMLSDFSMDFSLLDRHTITRNQVPGFTPDAPDLPEFDIRGHFFMADATAAEGVMETINPLTVKEDGSAIGEFSLAVSINGSDDQTHFGQMMRQAISNRDDTDTGNINGGDQDADDGDQDADARNLATAIQTAFDLPFSRGLNYFQDPDSSDHYGVWLVDIGVPGDMSDDLVRYWANAPAGYSVNHSSYDRYWSYGGTAAYSGAAKGLSWYKNDAGEFTADVELMWNFDSRSVDKWSNGDVAGTISGFSGPGANPNWKIVIHPELYNDFMMTDGESEATHQRFNLYPYGSAERGRDDPASGAVGDFEMGFSDGGAVGVFHATQIP